MFKVNNKDTRKTSITLFFLWLTLNIFYIFSSALLLTLNKYMLSGLHVFNDKSSVPAVSYTIQFQSIKLLDDSFGNRSERQFNPFSINVPLPHPLRTS